MRVLAVIPVAVLAIMLALPGHDEPDERAMRLAFEDSLSLQVQNAMDFAAESGGPKAVAAIRDKGNDRFTINAFQKLKCAREAHDDSHVCEFSVDIELSNGPLQKTLTGRFQAGPHGLTFLQDI